MYADVQYTSVRACIQIHTAELHCDGYPRLYGLNGLAGGGIARGPAAGEHVARLVAAELGMAAAPHAAVAFFSGATVVFGYILGGVVLVVALSACCACGAFCFDWLELDEDFRNEARQAASAGLKLGRRRARLLQTARKRRAACVASAAFVVSTVVLCALIGMTAIAWEGVVFLAPYLVVYLALNLTLCTGCVLCPAELARRCFCCCAVRAADNRATVLAPAAAIGTVSSSTSPCTPPVFSQKTSVQGERELTARNLSSMHSARL